MSNEPKYSIHLFGSQARGDSDIHSDQDILVLYDDHFRPEVSFKEANVVFYNLKHFLHLAQHGSLFCKHIIDESILLRGNRDHIAAASRVFTPKTNYESEARKGLALIDCLARPINHSNSLVYGDILAVFLRNFFIQIAASRKIFIFSIREISAFAEQEFGIEANAFTEARKIKERYRSGSATVPEDADAIKSMVSHVTGGLDYCRREILPHHPLRTFRDGYVQLREFEAWYWTNFGSLSGSRQKLAEELLAKARSPSRYRFFIRNDVARRIEAFFEPVET